MLDFLHQFRSNVTPRVSFYIGWCWVGATIKPQNPETPWRGVQVSSLLAFCWGFHSWPTIIDSLWRWLKSQSAWGYTRNSVHAKSFWSCFAVGRWILITGSFGWVHEVRWWLQVFAGPVQSHVFCMIVWYLNVNVSDYYDQAWLYSFWLSTDKRWQSFPGSRGQKHACAPMVATSTKTACIDEVNSTCWSATC